METNGGQREFNFYLPNCFRICPANDNVMVRVKVFRVVRMVRMVRMVKKARVVGVVGVVRVGWSGSWSITRRVLDLHSYFLQKSKVALSDSVSQLPRVYKD